MLFLSCVLLIGASVSPLRALPEAPIRAIHLSTHGGGREWGTAVIEETMAELRTVGANWVAIHPYARIDADGGVRFRPLAEDPSIRRPIRAAQAEGLKILIKPHLAYWGSPFSWRGEIEFEQPAARSRFWREYRKWILHLARESASADAFILGTELDRLLVDEEEWRDLIAELRLVTEMPLSYAANWTDFERVPFWDALDFVGVQCYFPVADSANPDQAQVDRGWAELAGRLARFSERVGRPVVLSELGYNWNAMAAQRPWEYRNEGPQAEELQLRCFRAALSAIETEPAILGAFLWKWFPEPHPVGRNFPVATPKMRALLREYWLRPTR